MINKWGKKYTNIKNYFKEEELDYYFTYLKYNPMIRRYIYTTNSIENLNRQIRKGTKHKISFEQESKMLDYIYVVIRHQEKKSWEKYPLSHFNDFGRFQTQ